jgi:hypothetical protein
MNTQADSLTLVLSLQRGVSGHVRRDPLRDQAAGHGTTDPRQGQSRHRTVSAKESMCDVSEGKVNG